MAILALLVVPAKAQNAHDIMIVNAMAPASLTQSATSAAIYFGVMNHGPTDDVLLSATTPRANAALLHENYQEGDVMKMRELTSLAIPKGGFVELQPGSRHLMLTGLTSPFKPGEVIPLELKFEKAGVVKLDVKVGKAAAGHIHSNGG